MRVLLVDDNADARELIRYAEKPDGIRTVTCATGAEALNYLAENEVDAVVLDLAMPVLDGLTVAKEIRKNEQNAPDKKPVKIAFYTAQPVDDTVRRVQRKVGAEKIFQKPGDDITSILFEIREWLDDEVKRKALQQ